MKGKTKAKLHNSLFEEKGRKSHKYLKMLLIESFCRFFFCQLLKVELSSFVVCWAGDQEGIERNFIGNNPRCEIMGLLCEFSLRIFHPINISAHFFYFHFSESTTNEWKISRFSMENFILKASKIDKKKSNNKVTRRPFDIQPHQLGAKSF